MPQLDLGRVVGKDGKDATINGVNSLTLQGSENVDVTQTGSTVTISAKGLETPANAQSKADAALEAAKTFVGNNAVPNTRKVNGKPLSADVTLEASDIGAATADHGTHVTYGTSNPVADGAASPGSANSVSRSDHKHPHDTTKQDKLTGETNQFVGFDEDGNAIAMDMNENMFKPATVVYGFELDLDESAPASKIRYIETNASFQAAAMNKTTHVLNPGDWADAWFMKDIRPVVLQANGVVKYELNKNNYKQKFDGTAIDVTDTGTDNVMVGISTVWLKIDTSVARKPKFYFANNQVDNTYKAYAHTDANGNIMPYTYMPAYNGWVDTNSRLRSISGKTPTRSQTGEVQITEARANNPSGSTIWDLEVLSDRELITLLLMLIGKSTDTQAVFGIGNQNGYNSHASGSDENGVLPTGTMDEAGLWWGSDETNLGVKVFGIEHFWGNIWRRTHGCINDKGTIKVKLTKGTQDGSTVTDYNTTGDGYITVGACPTGSGSFISDMYVGDFGLLPSACSGSDSTHYCDAFWSNNSQVNFALFGGGSNDGSRVGAFALDWGDAVSRSNWNIGASASCKPLV